MSDDSGRFLFEAHRSAQEKYIYFLLAAAGAAIGFAISRTDNVWLSPSQIPLGIAVTCWGLSFYFGCRFIRYVQSMLYSNSELLRIRSGRHPEVGDHPEFIDAASRGILQAIKTNNDRADRLARWQLNLLVAGAIFFISWHILEMYLRQ